MRLRLIEEEIWPVLIVSSKIKESETDEGVFQIPDDLARQYMDAVALVQEAENNLLGWLWNRKHGDAMRAIPAIMNKFEERNRA